MAVGVIKNQNFVIIAMSPVGKGLSGGDRIFIELARNFGRMGLSVQIFTWEDGVKMIEKQQLIKSEIRNQKSETPRKNFCEIQQGRQLIKTQNLNIRVLRLGFWCRAGFIVCYLARIVRSVFEALRLSFIRKSLIINHKSTVVYSASDFWMDVFPAFILKLKNRKIKWVASWYQTAPNPFSGYASPFYWISQFISKPLIKRFADFVIVNNEDERKQFPSFNKKNKIFVFIGAVDIEKIQTWIRNHPDSEKKYHAVFQGRFHPQKGVLELIDIWKIVVEKKPDAKLVMIGDGPLMQDVRSKIYDLRLKNNIILIGYLFDGEEKYRIFTQSKIVVHPALYDSGGMAAGEAMVFGLPCVGFDLKSYQSYYPKGMIKVKIGDLAAFAEAILKFLEDEKYRAEIGNEAKKMIEEKWSWEKRAQKLLRIIGENYV